MENIRAEVEKTIKALDLEGWIKKCIEDQLKHIVSKEVIKEVNEAKISGQMTDEDVIVRLKTEVEEWKRICREKDESHQKDAMEWRKINQEKDTVISLLRKDIADMQHALVQESSKVDELEQYSKKEDLIFRGVPDFQDDDIDSRIIQVIERDLGVPVSSQDISIAHKLPKNKYDRNNPIIVRFSNRKKKNQVYQARRVLRNRQENQPKIIVHEHLTRRNADLLKRARLLIPKGYAEFVWTNNCQILVRMPSQNNQMGIVKNIKSVQDILDIESKKKD